MDSQPHVAAAASLPLAPISRQRFQRMVDAGIYGPGDHVELIQGMVVAMSPQGTLHAHTVQRLTLLLVELFGRTAGVRPQLPFAATGDSLPEPDLVVTPGRQARDAHPSRALLVVEVADTSLDYDRTVKAGLYATAEVPEYWIVDVQRQAIEVYSGPSDGQYGSKHVARRGDVIQLVAAVGKAVVVEEVFAD